MSRNWLRTAEAKDSLTLWKEPKVRNARAVLNLWILRVRNW